MSKYRKEIGAWGEGVAAEWLAERGYKIIARNVRADYGEIDIVAQIDDVTIFVEVKTLTSSKNFFPEANITPKKQQRMINAAQTYADAHEIDSWQIDAIAVEGKPDGAKPIVTHFENAV